MASYQNDRWIGSICCLAAQGAKASTTGFTGVFANNTLPVQMSLKSQRDHNWLSQEQIKERRHSIDKTSQTKRGGECEGEKERVEELERKKT